MYAQNPDTSDHIFGSSQGKRTCCWGYKWRQSLVEVILWRLLLHRPFPCELWLKIKGTSFEVLGQAFPYAMNRRKPGFKVYVRFSMTVLTQD